MDYKIIGSLDAIKLSNSALLANCGFSPKVSVILFVAAMYPSISPICNVDFISAKVSSKTS